jgi:hypothetical protein
VSALGRSGWITFWHRRFVLRRAQNERSTSRSLTHFNHKSRTLLEGVIPMTLILLMLAFFLPLTPVAHKFHAHPAPAPVCTSVTDPCPM